MIDGSTARPKMSLTDDTLTLGICPANESEPQYGSITYRDHAMDKGSRYAALLRLAYPGARFGIMYDAMDFRRQDTLTVCLIYDTDDPAQVSQSYEIEKTIPSTWEELETMAKQAKEANPCKA
jgi:hypothetical protein